MLKYKGILLSGNSGGQKLHLNEYELHALITIVTGTSFVGTVFAGIRLLKTSFIAHGFFY
ncbi:hypothetical protein [Pseudoalteromonas sp. S558]|uniref:hypothetical protein n=1 Tax=Pseudoalteromonas sp. S558 TaxID=2066515 RepID=UPI00110AE208|nr:hypothetical protein [Pseudoalteromonas sp. S558]TMO04618.1 hypothetical protein CWB66_08210 [Pseudoalteromonas sp. S558]